MIVTIDSNVPVVPARVARLLPHHVPSAPWCEEPCLCGGEGGGVIDGVGQSAPTPSASTALRVFYDTPIAMCPDADAVFDAARIQNVVSFVYLDTGVPNRSYGRIVANLARLEKAAPTTTVVLVLSDRNATGATPRGTYTVSLEKNNCGTDMVAKFLALMVNTFVYRKVVLHPDSLLDLVRRVPDSRERRIESGRSSPVRCDLYRFSKRNCSHRAKPCGNGDGVSTLLDDCDLVACRR